MRRHDSCSFRVLDIFIEVIAGLLPIRAIEFTIDVIIEVEPVCKTPYRMRTKRQAEVKRQVEKLMKLESDRSSVSSF